MCDFRLVRFCLYMYSTCKFLHLRKDQSVALGGHTYTGLPTTLDKLAQTHGRVACKNNWHEGCFTFNGPSTRMLHFKWQSRNFGGYLNISHFILVTSFPSFSVLLCFRCHFLSLIWMKSLAFRYGPSQWEMASILSNFGAKITSSHTSYRKIFCCLETRGK